MTIPLITGNFKVSQGDINNLINQINAADIAGASAGSLTGTTLAANVVNSSLTSIGTIVTGVWNGTTVTAPFGGTGNGVYAIGDLLYASATNALTRLPLGSSGTVLTVDTITGLPAWDAVGSSAFTSITSGTNTIAAMVVGSGATLAASGTGTIAATTAATLATARAINGVNFDGSAPITVAAAGSTLTGTSLASGILSSSLTSVGTLAGLAVSGNAALGTVNGNTLTTGTGTLTIAAGKTFTASNTITLVGTDTVSMNVTNNKIRVCGFSTTSPVIGQQGTYFVCPFSGTIAGWSIAVDTGTCTVQTWKIASGTASPTVSNSISTAGVQLTTGSAIESTTVTDFTTTTVTAGDIFAFNLSAFASCTKINFQLQITAT